MGAVHFLPHAFRLPDRDRPNIQHELELMEKGGELVLRLWIGGVEANMAVECVLTKAQAEQLANGAQDLAARLGF